MVSIVVFHIVMLLLGLAIVIRVVPGNIITNMLGYLHSTIGITAPPAEQARTVALIWIGSTVIIVDGCLALLVFLTRLVNS